MSKKEKFETDMSEEIPNDSATDEKKRGGKGFVENIIAITCASIVVLLSYVTWLFIDSYDPFSSFLSAARGGDDFLGLSSVIPFFIQLGSVLICFGLHIVSYIFVVPAVFFARKDYRLVIFCLVLCQSAPLTSFHITSEMSATVENDY